MASFTIHNAITGEATSVNQAVAAGAVTIALSTSLGSGDKDFNMDAEVFVDDVPAFQIDKAPWVRTFIVGAVNVKVKATGTAANTLTCKLHDSA